MNTVSALVVCSRLLIISGGRSFQREDVNQQAESAGWGQMVGMPITDQQPVVDQLFFEMSTIRILDDITEICLKKASWSCTELNN